MAVLSSRNRPEPYARLGRLLPAAFGALALLVALAQQPGKAYHDTRIELTVDPGLFLHRVASVWSSSTDLGHVQSGQWVGYLWPVAPYYSLAHWAGLPTWVSQRLWLALLMGLAAWGAVRVMDELYDRRRGLAHVTAGLLYGFSPYVVTYADRTATLLAYTALPWLMVVAHRSLGRPRSWVGPVLAGLIVTSAGGGLNAALLAWVLAAPLALVAYEVMILGRDQRDGLVFLWRSATCVVLASLWWLVPVLLQSRYGANFLSFTEQPQTIFATPSASESFRLLGLWLDYFGATFGTGLRPSVPGVAPYLFSATTIVGSFAVPLLAFGALRWTKRWAYAPFFGLLGTLGVVFMAIGFPPHSHINHVVTSLYYDVPALQFLRTTYKAAPLLALSLGCLGGAGAAALLARLRTPGIRLLGTRVPVWTALVLVAIPVLWARPLVARHLINPERTFESVPLSWRAAVADAGGATRRDRRIMVIPGEHLAWYRWAGTDEPIGPALSRLPVVIHQTDRYADERSAQLLASIDELVQQGRLVPGQLKPLLQLIGVGQVLVPTDGVTERNGALDPVRVSAALAWQGGFDRPAGLYGLPRNFSPAAGWSGDPLVLPDLRRYRLAPGPGIVRAHPRAGAVLLDGDAEGVVELAADGGLDTSRALIYAAAEDRPA
ncbi:MAG TPA: alpha-(1-_3)-arabinofuranosyltransferase family protein, partial [Solirubrobacteraceae bacterium]